MNRKGTQFMDLMQRNFDALFGLSESKNGDIKGFMDLARACLETSGVERPGSSHDQLLARAMSTSDYPAILSNTTNKLLQESFRKQPATYGFWAEPWGVADFKDAEIARIGYPGDMPEVKEMGEYEHLEVEEGSETARLATYGGMLGFSRQMLINDSLGAFRERTRAGGVIARQTISRKCYRKLLNPGVLSDSAPFFDASRNNLLEGSSGDTLELNADNLGRAVAALREQKDDAGNYLNLEPKYLVVPPSLEVSAWSLCLGNSLLGQSNDGIPNPFKDRYGIVPVVAPELADSSLGGNDKDWFVFGDPQVMPASFKVLTLTGDWPEPAVEQRPIFERDEVQMKIRIDFEPAAINPRGVAKVQPYSG